MTTYLRASEIIKKPVVTLGGEDVAQVKDILFDATKGRIRGFTLTGRGLLSGPLHRELLWRNVHRLGPDAVMVRTGNALEDDDTTAQTAEEEPGGGNVLGVAMTTRSGTRLGTITDAIIETGTTPVVAGYELESPEHGSVLVPVAGPVTVSSERVLVPDETAEHSAGTLESFGTAAEGLRRRLEQDEQGEQED
ncbi:PRC-barrel domain-containing protein [Streptomyces sp. NPDC006984]|uniref:PRC-barrel domain-containing protein n=1 Tax=Streptomyces sp. NPDC006984 TaxID=3155463 RepID=UPI0033C1BECC